MTYDVQIGNTVRRGITYAELVSLPIEPNTFIRRANGDWITALNCVELTHILAGCPTPSPTHHHTSHLPNENCSENEYSINEYEDTEEEDENDFTEDTHEEESNTHVQSFNQNDDVEEEHIFIPTAEYFKCRQKRKAAIIGVCTLGIAGLSLIGVGNTWRSNIFAGTSFSANAGIGFVLKCLSFFLLTALIAIPYFIYSVFALIYYSIRLSNLKR